MKSRKPALAPSVLLGLAASLMVFPLLAGPPTTPANIDVSQLSNNESEETIAVNPTNPNNIVIVTNVVVPAAGMFAAVSLDGGSSWATRIIGNNDNLGAACCDPSLSFDEFGNLFLTYLFNVGNTVPVALSTDGGLSFNSIANIAKPASSKTQTSNRSEEHTSELQSQSNLVCRLLLEKKNKKAFKSSHLLYLTTRMIGFFSTFQIFLSLCQLYGHILRRDVNSAHN